VETEGKVSTPDVIIIVLVAFVTAVDVLDDGEQNRKEETERGRTTK
jgi:hypothetical protein